MSSAAFAPAANPSDAASASNGRATIRTARSFTREPCIDLASTLPHSAFRLPPSAFRLPPSAFRLGSLARLRIPLPLAHAGDRYFREHAVLRERVVVHEGLGFGAAFHVDDQQGAEELRAVIAFRRPGENQYVFLAEEIFHVRLQALFALGSEVGCGYARDGPKH